MPTISDHSNHIYLNDDPDENLGGVLVDHAKSIINNKRRFIMEAVESGDFKMAWNQYAIAGETTFLINFCKVLLKKDRKKSKDLTDKDWVMTAWDQDGLKVNWQQYFAPEWVPQLKTHGGEWLLWLYEKVPKEVLESRFADFLEQTGPGKKRKGEEHGDGDEKAKVQNRGWDGSDML
ncbi:MAG: hypothetical protein Q9171_004547 [Xanthocarpia ochracea]